ncbi:MAG: hypothetical protein U0807_07165 [Candidatus Binatia bacterium]
MDGAGIPLITAPRRLIIPEVLPTRAPLWRRRSEVPSAGCLRPATCYDDTEPFGRTVGIFLDLYG